VKAILVLLAAVAALATLVWRLKVADPILMVVGDLALGIVPGLPRTTLPPGAVCLLHHRLPDHDPQATDSKASIGRLTSPGGPNGAGLTWGVPFGTVARA
jgi:hypothetical protein